MSKQLLRLFYGFAVGFFGAFLIVGIAKDCSAASAASEQPPDPIWIPVATVEDMTFFLALNLMQEQVYKGHVMAHAPVRIETEQGGIHYQEFFADCTTRQWLAESNEPSFRISVPQPSLKNSAAGRIETLLCGDGETE